MSRESLIQIFQDKLVLWILVPGLFMALLLLSIAGFSLVNVQEKDTVQLARSLAHNVDFYIDEAENVLRSMAAVKGTGNNGILRSYFTGVHANFRQFERILLLDKQENIIAIAPQGIKGIDFPIRFMDSGGGASRILSSPIISPHSGKLVVYISIKVDGGGKIVAELNMDKLQEFLYGFLSSETIIILADSYGNLIVHPNRELVQMQANVGGLKILMDTPLPGHGGFYRSGRNLFFGSVEKIHGTGWNILVASSAYYIFRPAITLGVIVFVLAGIFFIILLVALKKEFRTKVVTPLVGYIDMLSAVAEGKYSVATTRESDFSELDELGRVFNVMSSKVSEREHDLKVSKNYFQSVIDSMPSALIWVNENMEVCQGNSSALDLFNIESTAIEAVRADDFFSGRAEIILTITDAKEQNEARTLERAHLGKDVSRVYEVTAFPVSGVEFKGVVVRIDDVTSRVRMEELMVQTEKMMSVGGLAAGMAHEINNPLGGIMQGAQNLERKFSPQILANRKAAEEAGCSLESMSQYLEYRKVNSIIEGIKQSGKRAARIVSNMLEFSKPGKASRTSVDLHELIENVIELAGKDYDLKKKYDFMHIVLTREFSTDLPLIICSKPEIEQVLFNLLKNSAQAMNENKASAEEPQIWIRTSSQGNYVTIEIEDNGPGMTEDVRKRVFEPFFTTKAAGTGTGLGLSVSYFIITQNHGGTFSVRSIPDVGATFTITLPVLKN
ncbi:ATP-binding protein [Maridesulfovibrio sp.]|uniref:ATP-binding protein n=1 Tax=Maridesulfovibrio sp. TaxID=2795000 RepID=UPI0029F50826|nr:ATP-binding protein [Maridesulfovibrio sp.]